MKTSWIPVVCFWLALLCVVASARADEVRMLCDFEGPADLKLWDVTAGHAALVTDGATHGTHALEITFDPAARYHPAYLNCYRLPRDWSPYDALVLDVWNPSDRPMPGYVLIADQAWQDKGGTYWNRHNSADHVPAGPHRVDDPRAGPLPRRGRQPQQRHQAEHRPGQHRARRLRLRRARARRAASSSTTCGWSRRSARPASGPSTSARPARPSCSAGRPSRTPPRTPAPADYGWGPQGGTPWDGAARDTTFGPVLIRDFCEAGGYHFHVDVPAGDYRVMVIYENCGYWGGEQAQQTERRVLVDGREVWHEERPDGAAHALYRFENVEPIGVTRHLGHLHGARAGAAGRLRRPRRRGRPDAALRDRPPLGQQALGLALHRKDDAASAAWLKGQLDALATEFRRKAVCLDEPAPRLRRPGRLAAARPGGLARAHRGRRDAQQRPAGRRAVAGRHRALAAGGPGRVRAALRGPAARCATWATAGWSWSRLPVRVGSTLVVQVVRYNTSRGFGTIAYHVRAHTLRPAERSPCPPASRASWSSRRTPPPTRRPATTPARSAS